MTVAMALSEAHHHTMSKLALLKTVVPKTERAEWHGAPRGQKKGDGEVAQTIHQERIPKSMVEHIVGVSAPQGFR